MHTKLFAYENPSLSPEARLLLLQWALQIGLEKSVECGLKDLFKRFGFSYVQGRRAWKVLIADKGEPNPQFIEVESVHRKERGRPKLRYRLSEKLLKDLSSLAVGPQTQHLETLVCLASTESLTEGRVDLRKEPRCRRKYLSLPNRWLVMILLFNANASGAVTDLGLETIQRLTGMSRFRVINQTEKLIYLGVIAHHQPEIFGSDSNNSKAGIYFIELAHPLISRGVRQQLTYVFESSRLKDRIETGVVGGIVDALLAASVSSAQIKSLVIENDDGSLALADGDLSDNSLAIEKKLEQLDEVRHIFRAARNLLPDVKEIDKAIDQLPVNYIAENAEWLLASIHVDAMVLLTAAWVELEGQDKSSDQSRASVIESISTRLGALPNELATVSISQDDKKHTYKWGSSSIEAAESSIKSQLSSLLCALSYHVAMKIQRMLIKWGHSGSEGMSYTLVPVHYKLKDGREVYGFELRGYGLGQSVDSAQERVILEMGGVGINLRKYWQANYAELFAVDQDVPMPS